MSYYKNYAIIYSISIIHENKKYLWVANAMNYPKAKEINIKKLQEGTHISKGLQEIYNLKKLETVQDDLIKFEEHHSELKDFYPSLMSLAGQLLAREHIVRQNLKKYNKDLIIFN